MRLLHTADWHLGQTLHGVSRAYEHQRFLEWLLRTIRKESVDALLIVGDVFDVATPSATAQEQYYQFLAECRRQHPQLDILVVGGNHDSPSRLDAPGQVLGALGIEVIGGMPDQLDRCVAPIRDQDGDIAAWVLAVPFLRPKDLPDVLPLFAQNTGLPDDERFAAHRQLIAGHRTLYAELLAKTKPRMEPHHALIATGHCHMKGAKLSEYSERPIQVGGQHTLPLDIFPKEAAYVALGHLHLPQAVLEREHIRYCGSPIPLSLAERNYEHQVVLVEFQQEKLERIQPLLIPKSIAMTRVPEEHQPLELVLELLRALPREGPPGAPLEARPYLEVRVALETANPRVRQDVEAALEGAWARLLKIDVQRPEKLREEVLSTAKKLDSIAPIDVFKACYKRTRDQEAPEDLEQLFCQLLESVQRAEQP